LRATLGRFTLRRTGMGVLVGEGTGEMDQRASSRRAWAVYSVLAVVVLIGLVLGLSMIAGVDPLAPAAQSAPEYGVGDDVPTSFGFVAIEHATAISGLSDSDVTGAHGVPGLVEAGTIDVQVAATMTNHTADVLRYTAAQFELLDADGEPVSLSREPQLPGELQPDAAIDFLLDFVTTTDARPFRVRFRDVLSGEVRLVDLGEVGCEVQSGTGVPLPVLDGCAQPKSDHHDE
jgi:hypothetical protein